MTLSTIVVAAMLHAKVTLPWIYGTLALGNFIAVALILRAWGADGVKDVAAFLFKIAFGAEVRGLEHLPKPGEKALLAPNHISLVDAPLIHSIAPSHASYAIDTATTTWWVKPFLKLVDACAIDPTRPLGIRHLIQTVKDGGALVIFPEGRLTVTGGLMKVYDGAAMIADKADAPIIPIRIDGLERSPFGYLSAKETKKVWFPKTT